MSKRKGKDPNVTAIAESYLSSFDGIARLNSLEKLLELRELPIHHAYPTSSMLHQMNGVFSRAIGEGINLPGRDDSWILARLVNLRGMLADWSCREYRELRNYQLHGASAKWSQCSLVFHVCSSMLVLIHALSRGSYLKPIDVDYLSSRCLLMHPTKQISAYTQTELRQAACCLASRWNSLEFHPSLADLLEHLHCRVAFLTVGRHAADVLDGKEGRDKFRTAVSKPINPNDRLIRREFSCSPDYISDIASMLTSMRTSIYLRTVLTDRIESLDATPKWEGYDSSALEIGFARWLKGEVGMLEGQKFKDDLRTAIMLMCALRPGDYERYMRDNSGRTATDAAVVIEHCFTPLQGAWWTSTSLRGGIPKLIEDPNPTVRSVTVLKVFHHACKSKSQFNWWLNCFAWENDVLQKTDMLRKQRAPVVIRQLGEYNLWYLDKIYRTKTVQRALIMWTITMVSHFQCTFTDSRCTSQKLDFLAGFLREWNGGRLKDEVEDAQMGEGMEEDGEVFCEVIDPLFAQ